MFIIQICARNVNNCKYVLYVVSIVSRLPGGRYGFRTSAGTGAFYLTKKSRLAPGNYRSPVGNESLSQGKSSRGVKLITSM
jgi:hypothetical protein